MSRNPLLLANQTIISIQIIIFFVFVKKMTLLLNEQKEAEMRLFGFDEERYEQQDKGLKNLKTTLHIYAGL